MSQTAPNKSLRPRMVTVFVAAFLAGGTAAVGVNRFIDVTRTRSKATVECEPIFVALRDLPAGNPVTVWDVKLRDWPKAMVPQAALRPGSFDGIAWPEGHVARLTLREGQPVLRSHLQAAMVDAHPAKPQTVAIVQPAAVAQSEPATPSDPVAQPVAPVAQPAAVVQQPSTPEVPVVADSTVADSAAVASNDTSEPRNEPADASAENPDEPAPSLAEVETAVAASPTPAAPVDAAASATDQPTTAESLTGEGWPSAAETAAGSEAAMRFLVVPERIAIMADELTAPRKPERPSTPVASVATQTKPAGQTPQPKQKAQPTPTVQPRQPALSNKATSRQSIPKATYRDQEPSSTQAGKNRQQTQGAAQPQTRSAPAAQRTTSAAPPRVTVEPDPESHLADEAARTPILKSVFPNMAAGLEKIESEMSRFRRERLGSLFRAEVDPEAEASDDDGNEPSGQWLPSLRLR